MLAAMEGNNSNGTTGSDGAAAFFAGSDDDTATAPGSSSHGSATVLYFSSLHAGGCGFRGMLRLATRAVKLWEIEGSFPPSA